MTYVIALPCVDVKDRACIDECPVDCIYEGERSLYIHPDECVDCGACEPVCPVEAIYYEDDVPDEWRDYYTANVEFFDDIGSPGGAAKVGVYAKDHPIIAALPPQGTRMGEPPDLVDVAHRRRRSGRTLGSPEPRRAPGPRCWWSIPAARATPRPSARTAS